MTSAKSRPHPESTSKRKEQNRVAQRAFRKRQREYYREVGVTSPRSYMHPTDDRKPLQLEQQVVDMASKIKGLTKTNVDLQSAMKRLQQENVALKRRRDSSLSNMAPAPMLEESVEDERLLPINEVEAPSLLSGVQAYPRNIGPLVFDDRSRTSSPSESTASSTDDVVETTTPVLSTNPDAAIHQPIYGDDGTVLGISPLSLAAPKPIQLAEQEPPMQLPVGRPQTQPAYEVINNPQPWHRAVTWPSPMPDQGNSWSSATAWGGHHSQSFSAESGSRLTHAPSFNPHHRASLPTQAACGRPGGWRNANLHLSLPPAQTGLYRDGVYQAAPSFDPSSAWNPQTDVKPWPMLGALKSVGNGDAMAFTGGHDVITPIF